MYNDYKPTYTSNFELLPEIWIGIIVIILFISIVMLVSMWKIFRKAEKKGWYAFIPIYNLIVLLQIVNMSSWQVILYFIPLVNFYMLIMVPLNLAKVFHKSPKFGWGLALLPIVYYPILAFNKQAYIGINKDADFSVAVDPNQVPEISVSEIVEKVTKTQYPKPNITVGMGSCQVAFAVPKGGETKPEPEKPDLIEEKAPVQETPVLAQFQVPVAPAPVKPSVFLSPEQEENKVPEKEEIPSFADSFARLTPLQSTPSQPIENQPVEPQVAPAPQVETTPVAKEPIVELPKFPLPDAKEEYVTCPNCKAVIKKGAPRCFLCGTTLEK